MSETKSTANSSAQVPVCLSIDVEEYFHAANLSSQCPIRSWNKLPSSVERNTLELLDIFDEHSAQGTFFVLGYCAKQYPEMVKEILNRGHEIASHGYAHKSAYNQTRKQFRRDIIRSKEILEDISGQKIIGYRAPNFSIRDANLWAYEELVEAGYIYDSSLYPVRHDRYGNPHRGRDREIRKTEAGDITVLPLTTFPLLSEKLPIAGGAYWRLLPLPIILRAIKSVRKNSKEAIRCYIHPWEIDDTQPYFASLSLNKKLRHYTGIKHFKKKVSAFLKEFGSEKLIDTL